MRRTTVLPILVVLAIAMLAAACSKETSGLMPTAATPVGSTATAAAPADQGTVIDRTNGTMVRDAATVAAWTAENWTFDMAADLAVEGSGPISAVSGSCPAVVMTIYGIPVEVNAATAFPIGSTCSALEAGRVVRVRGLLYVVGSAFRVLATNVTIEGGVNTPVEGEGVVTEVTGTCPAATLTIRGVNVVLGAGTAIRWRNNANAACADIQVGHLLHVKAEITPTGTIIASSITIQNGTPPVNNPPGARTLTGTVSSVSGSCPTLNFKLSDRRVRTTSNTMYTGGACADIVSGARVEVRFSPGSGDEDDAADLGDNDDRVTALAVTFLRGR